MHMVWKSIGRVLEVFVNFSITITSKKSNLPQMHIGMEERGVKVWKLGNTNVKAIKNDIGEPPPPPDYVTAPTSKGFAQLPMDPLDFHRRSIYSNIFKVLSNSNLISRFLLTKSATTWGCNMTLLTPPGNSRYDSQGRLCSGIGGVMDYYGEVFQWSTCSVEDFEGSFHSCLGSP